MDLIKEVNNQLSRLAIKKKCCLVYLYSGGVDSSVLLDILTKLAHKKDFTIFLLHINYQLRGEESQRDATFVAQKAKTYNWPIKILNRPLAAKTSGVQQKARELRYTEALALAHQIKSNFIITAHHQNDQLETLLFNQKRGAGLRGKQGMKVLRPLDKKTGLFRPMLSISSDEIQNYAKQNKITYVFDSSNLKLSYRRNWIRHQQTPQLSKTARNQLLRDSKKAQKEFQKIEAQKKSWLKNHKSPEKGILISEWQSLNPNLKFYLIEAYLKERGLKKQLTKQHFLRIEKVIIAKNPSRFEIESLLICKSWDRFFILQKEHVNSFKKEGPFLLKQLGLFSLKDLGFEIRTKMVKINSIDRFFPKNQELFLQLTEANLPFELRFFKPGDLFWPLGCKGPKKLKKFFAEQKIPAFQRSLTPLICVQNRIAAILPYQIAHPFRITSPGTYLSIELKGFSQ